MKCVPPFTNKNYLLVKGGTHSFILHKMRTSFYKQDLFSDNHLHNNNGIAFGFSIPQYEMKICQRSHNKVAKTVYVWFEFL